MNREGPTTSLDLDALIARIQAEVARRRPATNSYSCQKHTSSGREETTDHADHDAPSSGSSGVGLREPDFKIMERYHLNDFLRYHGAEFINVVYLAVLGRLPDAAGKQFYLNKLNDVALEKPEIIGRIRYSREGRENKIKITGLKPVLAFQLFCRIPILGYLTRLVVSLVRLPKILIELRRLDNLALTRIGEEASAHEAQLSDLLNRVASVRSKLLERISLLGKLGEKEIERLRSTVRKVEQEIAEREPTDKEKEAAASIEQKLRGPESEIRERLKIYIPELEVCKKYAAPALDIGCGRGEWLMTATERGASAIGVEIDPILVRECQNKKLDVHLSDAFEYLERCSSNTFGLISVIHVIEHFPSSDVLRFLLESFRCLIPDGKLIVETPNPENLRVGAHTFYCDLTHQKPIPVSLLRIMVEECGFVNTRIKRLHPLDPGREQSQTDETMRAITNLVFGPQDYALITRKPKAS